MHLNTPIFPFRNAMVPTYQWLFAAFHFKYWWDLCILLDSFDIHLFSYDEEKIKKNSITNMYVISFLFQTFCLQLYLKGTFCLFCLLQNFLMTKYLFQTFSTARGASWSNQNQPQCPVFCNMILSIKAASFLHKINNK